MNCEVAYLFGKGPGLDHVKWGYLRLDALRFAVNHAILAVPRVDYGVCTDRALYMQDRWPAGCVAVVPDRFAERAIAQRAEAVMAFKPRYRYSQQKPYELECYTDHRKEILTLPNSELYVEHSSIVTALHLAWRMGARTVYTAGIHDGDGFAACIERVIERTGKEFTNPASAESYNAGYRVFLEIAEILGVTIKPMF